MSKFRISRQLSRTIAAVAGELRAELRQGGVKVTRDTLTAAIAGAVTQAVTGRGRELTAASAPATYNRAGDILGLAYQTYLARSYKDSLELVALAFQDPTSGNLIGAIVANNDEAKGDDEEHAGAFDNKLDDSDDDKDNDNATAALANADIDVDDDDDTEDDDDDDDDDDYTSDLNKAVDNVTAGLITADADDDDDDDATLTDDDDDASDDDDADADDDDVTGDDDDDDDDETVNADDDDDDDDAAANAQLGVTGDNMPSVMSKLIRRINDPSIIAAANKVSISGSDQDRKKAMGFLASAVNISDRKKGPRRPNRRNK